VGVEKATRSDPLLSLLNNKLFPETENSIGTTKLALTLSVPSILLERGRKKKRIE
jgi:hypothetical protein